MPPFFLKGGSYGTEMADHFGTGCGNQPEGHTLARRMVPLSHYGGTLL